MRRRRRRPRLRRRQLQNWRLSWVGGAMVREGSFGNKRW
jgi:hypothetical protein